MAPKKATTGKGKDKVGASASSSPPAKRGRTAPATPSTATPLALMPSDRRGDIPLTIDYRVDRVTVAAPNDKDQEFSKRHFLCSEAKRDFRLRMDNGKKMIQERGMEVPEPEAAPIRAKLEKRRWLTWCEKPDKANEDIVREFYANAAYTGSETMAWVRGTKVDYSPRMINHLLGINRSASHEVFDRYRRDVTYAEICPILSPKRTKMPEPHKLFYFQRTELTQEAKVWQYFISANLMPTTSVSTMHPSRAVLAAAIMTDIEINVGEIIYQEIRRCIKDLSLGPFFPHLIILLCDRVDVPNTDGDRFVGPRESIVRVHTLKHESTPDREEPGVASKQKRLEKAQGESSGVSDDRDKIERRVYKRAWRDAMEKCLTWVAQKVGDLSGCRTDDVPRFPRMPPAMERQAREDDEYLARLHEAEHPDAEEDDED